MQEAKKKPRNKSNNDLPMFQLNRYYTHERNGMFYVVRFYRGSNCSLTTCFSDEEQRKIWVENNCKGFVCFKPEHDNHGS